jgi:hypothetical protein
MICISLEVVGSVNPFNAFWHADLALPGVDGVNVCSKHCPLKAPLAIKIDVNVLSSMDEQKLIIIFWTWLNTRLHEALLCRIHSKLNIK